MRCGCVVVVKPSACRTQAAGLVRAKCFCAGGKPECEPGSKPGCQLCGSCGRAIHWVAPDSLTPNRGACLAGCIGHCGQTRCDCGGRCACNRDSNRIRTRTCIRVYNRTGSSASNA